jgi:hypothetical protein
LRSELARAEAASHHFFDAPIKRFQAMADAAKECVYN